MHDIERKPAQDDATVKITDLPWQEEMSFSPNYLSWQNQV